MAIEFDSATLAYYDVAYNGSSVGSQPLEPPPASSPPPPPEDYPPPEQSSVSGEDMPETAEPVGNYPGSAVGTVVDDVVY